MKFHYLLLLSATFFVFPVFAQEYNQHISKEFTLLKEAGATTLAIFNVDGFIKVEGYSGSKVQLEIDETLSADDNASLEAGKKEFKLDFDQSTDTVTAYIKEPYDSRPHRYRNWGNDGREIDYRYHLDFTVRVPFDMNLDISTVNDGIVTVTNVNGILAVGNVNDAIIIKNAKGKTSAHTVNGNVEVNYVSVPGEPSSYSTINGEIKIAYPGNFSADLEFKSMNGEFFTDFPDAQILPASPVLNVSHRGKGTVYKLNKATTVRVGAGGQKFKFETLNGNIYIKKQS
jgi:hypothetical protein